MKSRLFLSAIFKLRNLGLLALSVGGCALLASVFPVSADIKHPLVYVPAIAIYIGSVVQSLFSRKHHEDFNRKEKIRQIQNLNLSCLRLAAEARRHANPTYAQKLKKVIEDKNDIVNAFFRGEHSYLKEKIVEQTLNLVVSYIRLLTNYCIRSRELSEIDIGEVVNRINTNKRKIAFIKDPVAAEDVKKLLEMDERVVSRLKDEKMELERINARLEYMESTVGAFKHQIFSNIESEEMLEKLETVVNEASALDNVLEERRKNKLRM